MKSVGTGVVLSLALVLAGCGDSGSNGGRKEPTTPQEMYARVQELLKPSAEREGPDNAGALHWLTKAAEGGYVPAMTDLGGIYLEGGRGVERNGAEALKWFSRAAEQGNAAAYIFMGRILYAGMGVEKDRGKAMQCWQKAADSGIAEAHFYLGSALILSPDTVRDGAQHLERAAKQGKGQLAAAAATQLGAIYFKGLGDIQPDQPTAISWYRAAAKGGDPKSQHVYAILLLEGELVEKDEKAGMAYLRMAAGQDYPPAIAHLVNILRNSPDAEANAAELAAWEKRLEALRIR